MSYSYDDLDLILSEIAQKIQLSDTDYEKAIEHYNSIAKLLCDPGSDTAELDPNIYSQGSFRIHSTISNSDEKDEFDIDLLLELQIDPASEPEAVLDMVFKCLNTGRYSGKVKKKKRCVTINYTDMHLDVTPAAPLNYNPEVRPNIIFDVHPDRLDHVKAAPEGFAKWFDQSVLPRTLIEARARSLKADVAPVPDKKNLSEKPPKLVALQLIKRWRDMGAANHSENIEKIPSILLSKYIAEIEEYGDQSLYKTLFRAVKYLIEKMSEPIGVVENPNYPPDVLSDRWPGVSYGTANLPANQTAFLFDLRNLESLLQAMPNSNKDVTNLALVEGFGERATERSLTLMESNYFASKFGVPDDRSLVSYVKRTGSAILSAATLIARHEQSINWPRKISYSLHVTADLYSGSRAARIGALKHGEVVAKRRDVKFTAHLDTTGVPPGLKIYWRITNTGKEATAAKQLRGRNKDGEGFVRWESTKYTGIHWAQAFAVDRQGNLVGESNKFCIVVDA